MMKMRRVARHAQRLARRTGLDVGKPGGRWVPIGARRVEVPAAVDWRAVAQHEPVTIPIRSVVTAAGMSYADGGFHPFWATAQQLLQEPELPLDRSWLAHHYRRYCPTTANEALFGRQGPVVAPLDRLPARCVSVLWTMSLRDITHYPLEHSRPTESVHFGPTTRSYLQSTMEQMRRITRSIAHEGYRPFEHSGGIVEGYFLIDEERFRFIPTEGQHRIGAVRALGFDDLVVRVRRGLSAVSRQRLAYWSRARGRPYDGEGALQLFDRFFEVRSWDRLYGPHGCLPQ